MYVKSSNSDTIVPYKSTDYTVFGENQIECIIVPQNPTKKAFKQFLEIISFKSKELKNPTIWNGEFDLSKYGITTLEWSMFSGCGTPSYMDLSGIKTESITSLESIFVHADGVETINLSGWDLSNVKNKTFYIDSIDYITQNIDIEAYENERCKKNMNKDRFPDVFTLRLLNNPHKKLTKVIVKGCNDETKKYIEKLLSYIQVYKRFVTFTCSCTYSTSIRFVIKSPFKWTYSDENEEFIVTNVDTELLSMILENSISQL